MRLDKSFRVILNSPIFPQMTVDRAGDRSVRFGAQDESHLRVFLIKVTPVVLPLACLTRRCSHRPSTVQVSTKSSNLASRSSKISNHPVHRRLTHRYTPAYPHVLLTAESVF